MLEDCQASILRTQRKLRQRLPNFTGKIVEIDQKQPAPALLEQRRGKTDTANLAYVIYTSGSTGRPKGVCIQHGSAATLLHWAREVFAPEDLAGVLASTSICFDLSIFEIFAPLSWGGTVILAGNALHLPHLPAAEKVTLINTVPSAMMELMRMNDVPTGVRVVNLAGEALTRPFVEKIYQTTTVKSVFNLYGPTEDTTYSTYAALQRGDERVVEIGKPLPNTRSYVLDDSMELVPVGVPGILYLSGAGLARGYLGRGDLTAERFVPNPFSASGGERLYSTGDLVRYLPDGSMEFLGRADYQVKIRGYRIELGEIEQALQEHPALDQAAVLVRESGSGEKYLVAYVSETETSSALTVSDLRNYLKQRLPEYMVPSEFVRLERMPLTSNGKIDRKSLPASSGPLPVSRQHYVAPRDFMEKQLVRMWEDLLGRQSIGINENFFDVGGHSIHAVRLIARIEKQINRRLPVAAFFQDATVEHLAQRLRNQDGIERWSPLVPIQPNGTKLPLFFVHAIGGQALSYKDLGKHFDPSQPFYGLQSRHVNKELPQHRSLEDMATEYVDAIMQFQPVGPYRIGGWSMGGVVAFEMARQIRARGQEVPMLALVDSFVPSAEEAEFTPTQQLAVFALDLGFSQDHVAEAGRMVSSLAPDGHLSYMLSEAKEAGLAPSDMSLADLTAL